MSIICAVKALILFFRYKINELVRIVSLAGVEPQTLSLLHNISLAYSWLV